MNEILIYLKPLLLTIVLELAGAIILFRIKSRKDLILVVLVNIITNPLLVYFSLLLMYYLGIGTGTILTYLLLEPIVVFSEYLLYKKYLTSRNDHLIVSLTLNLISIIGGILCQRIMY